MAVDANVENSLRSQPRVKLRPGRLTEKMLAIVLKEALSTPSRNGGLEVGPRRSGGTRASIASAEFGATADLRRVGERSPVQLAASHAATPMRLRHRFRHRNHARALVKPFDDTFRRACNYLNRLEHN